MWGKLFKALNTPGKILPLCFCFLYLECFTQVSTWLDTSVPWVFFFFFSCHLSVRTPSHLCKIVIPTSLPPLPTLLFSLAFATLMLRTWLIFSIMHAPWRQEVLSILFTAISLAPGIVPEGTTWTKGQMEMWEFVQQTKYPCRLTGVCVWARAGEDEHSRRNSGRSQILEDLKTRPRNPAFVLHITCTIGDCHCFKWINLSVLCSKAKDRERLEGGMPAWRLWQ